MISWLKLKIFITRNEVKLSAVYGISFCLLGITLAGLGPSLPELGRRTNSTDSQMGFVLTVRAAGYLAGSMVGPAFDHFPGNNIIATSLIVCSLSAAILPFIRIYGFLFLIIPFQGISMGVLDTGGNVMTIWLHKTNVEPYLQTLHSTFALGGLIAPLLIGQIASSMEGSISLSWWIIAVSFIPAIILLFMFESPKDKYLVDGEKKLNYQGWQWFVIFGTALYLFVDVGAEAGMATFTVTYIIRKNLESENIASVINSTFWIFMLVGRLIAIPVSLFVKSGILLITSSIICTISMAILWIFNESVPALWIGIIGYGFGMSVAFATSMLLAQSYIPVNGMAGTIFVVGAAFGEMSIPALISFVLTQSKYMSLIYVCFSVSVLSFIISIFIMHVGKKCPKAPEDKIDLQISVETDTSSKPSEIEMDVLKF